MDGNRFDDLTRSLTTGGTRRGFLAGVAGLAAGLLGARETAAACPPDQITRRGLGCVCRATGRPAGAEGCPCPAGWTRCPSGPEGVCVDLASDPANCGGCGTVCDDGDACTADVCNQGACGSAPAVDCSTPPDDCRRPGTCISATGFCDYPINASAPCGLAAACAGDALLGQGTCSELGVCQAGATTPCGAYTCRDASCLTSCAGDGDCAVGHHCAGSTCVPDAVAGESCAEGRECVSDICDPDEGVCCDRVCAGICETCATGACRPASGPQPACGGGGACAGFCDGIDGTTCAFPGGATACGVSFCVDPTHARSFVCDGAGGCATVPHDCGLHLCDGGVCPQTCSGSDECVGEAYCDDQTSRCLEDKPDGESCALSAQCLSGHCVGGVCCAGTCPAPFGGTATCADGNTCAFACDTGFETCGDECCPDGRVCCDSLDGLNSVCCGEGGACVDGTCTVTCLEIGESCDGVDECCFNQSLTCGDNFNGNQVCCREFGGDCAGFPGSCCQLTDDDLPAFRQVSCSGSAGGFTCGGAGAECFGFNHVCVSGVCCRQACCAVGEACSDDGHCRLEGGATCSSNGQCAGELCCDNRCVERTDEHCAACDDVCATNEVCTGGQCLKRLGETCGSGAECADGFCYGATCCDECGGLCGKPRPQSTPCDGGDPGSYCCGGVCQEITPHWSQCGGCDEVCPFGDVCTDGHTCTCTESSTCASGSLDRAECGGSGLCVTTTEGDLACVQLRGCGQTCTTSAECPDTLICQIAPDGAQFCSHDWVCSESTCCGRTCSITMPNGRPL